MADQFLTINTRELKRYRRSTLKKLRGQMAAARRMFINNMAFKARDLYINYGIPRVMTVRNRNILRTTMRVTKATRKHEVATAGQIPKGMARYDALRQQEGLGSRTMNNRQPATKDARIGRKGKIKRKARFRGTFLDPDDIKVRGEKNRAHRVHVFLEMIHRENYKDPFIISGYKKHGLQSGLYTSGKKIKGARKRMSSKKGISLRAQRRNSRRAGASGLMRKQATSTTRQLVTLRTFNKHKTRIKRTRWMKPSNEKLLRQMDPKMEWRKAMRYALKRKR